MPSKLSIPTWIRRWEKKNASAHDWNCEMIRLIAGAFLWENWIIYRVFRGGYMREDFPMAAAAAKRTNKTRTSTIFDRRKAVKVLISEQRKIEI